MDRARPPRQRPQDQDQPGAVAVQVLALPDRIAEKPAAPVLPARDRERPLENLPDEVRVGPCPRRHGRRIDGCGGCWRWRDPVGQQRRVGDRVGEHIVAGRLGLRSRGQPQTRRSDGPADPHAMSHVATSLSVTARPGCTPACRTAAVRPGTPENSGGHCRTARPDRSTGPDRRRTAGWDRRNYAKITAFRPSNLSFPTAGRSFSRRSRPGRRPASAPRVPGVRVLRRGRR